MRSDREAPFSFRTPTSRARDPKRAVDRFMKFTQARSRTQIAVRVKTSTNVALPGFGYWTAKLPSRWDRR